MNDDNIKEWITINHQHVPIKEGESKGEVAKKFVANKMSRVAKNKDKYDKISEFKKRKQSNIKDNLKYNISNNGNKYELNKEDKEKVFEKLNLNRGNKHLNEFEQNGSSYKMRQDVRERYEKELGLRKYRDLTEKPKQDEEEPTPKKKVDENKKFNDLLKFTRENKDQIDKWVNEFDDEARQKAGEKIKKGEGLTRKEYFGFLGSGPQPGDVILEEFPDGENAIVANDGEWVRESRLKEYNENPKANKDAVYSAKDDEDWENQIYNEFKEKYSLDDDYKKISDFKEKKQSNRLTRQQMAEALVDDQIKRGIVKKENREAQIEARLNGRFKMSENDLREYYNKYLK